MANLAFRSFTTFGYFGATLLIVIVAVLSLTSVGGDSSGQQALGTATPAPTRVSVGPGGDVSSIGEGIEAAMREYLAWETGLVAQVARDGDAPFLAEEASS